MVSPPKQYEATSDRTSTPTSWERFDPRLALERRWRRDDETLDALVEEREQRAKRTLEIGDLSALFAPFAKQDDPLSMVIVEALALWLWGKTPRLGKSWYRRDPKRSPYSSLGQALRRLRESDLCIGLGSMSLEVAETRYEPSALPEEIESAEALLDGDVERARELREKATAIRRVGGMRSGITHTVASRNGSTGGARNLAAIDLTCRTEQLIAESGVANEDLRALSVMHAEAKPNRRAAYEYMLRAEGVIGSDTSKEDVGKLIADHRRRLAKRLEAATARLEKSLRRVAPNAVNDAGELRAPDDVSLLRPASDDGEEPVAVGLGFGFGVGS